MILLRHSTIKISTPEAVARVFQELLKLEDALDQEKEHFYVMHVNARKQINLVELVAIGTLDSVNIHVREVFRRAIIEGAHSIIVAHNHPSGDPEPSENDSKTTHQLFKAGSLLNIPLLDHVVFTTTQYYSFKWNNTYSQKSEENKGGEAK